MKTTYKFLSAALLILGMNIFQAMAQNIAITPGKVRNEEGQEVDGWVAHPEQPGDYATKTFESFLKNSMGTKVSRRAKTVLIVEKFKMEEVSPLRGDLRAVVIAGSNGTEVGFTFSPGYDIHFEPKQYPKEYAKLESFVRKYVKYHYTEYYKDQTAKTTKEIANQKSDAGRLEGRIAKLKEEIAQNEKKAADGKESKVSEKNAKLQMDVDKYTGELTKIQDGITKLEETLVQVGTSMKKISEL